MQKFKTFMKSTKGLLLLAIVLFGTLFFAFTKNGDNKNTITQKQKLLATVGAILEGEHYSPKKINDVFSKQVFKKYLEELDPDKNLFVQSDIASLKKYELTIDDEIHGAEIKFEPAVSLIYDKRLGESIAIYKEILTKPFDFTVNETIEVKSDKMDYPKNDAERKDRWRKKLKLITLERYNELLELRNKDKTDTAVNKSDSELEKIARDRVMKSLDRYYTRIKATYDDNERFNSFINVITNLMDPHTDYFPPVEKRGFDEMMSGRFFGIGAQLKEEDGQVKIATILPSGPASKGNELIANDIILKVAQGNQPPVDIAGYGVTDAVKLIRGEKGTEVRLTVKNQDGTIKVISFIREEIVQDESYARSAVVNDGKEKIGYIYLQDFYANFEDPQGRRCSDDVAQEILKLKDEGVKGIILDLRFNGGGSLYEVVKMVGLFIGQGPIVQVRDKDGKSSVLSDRNSDINYDGPLAVMVNEGSASASEIFAAAIQDYKRGVIVGSSSTYGKGTVQRQIPLGRPTDNYGNTEYGAIKLTFQKFYRINGGSTQLKGVTPDIIIPDQYDYLKIREKDESSALPWDEIAKAPFQQWQSNVDVDAIIKKENQSIASDPTFSLIKQNTDWLAKNIEAPVNLNLKKYKENQSILRTTDSQLNKLTKLPLPMNIEVAKADMDKFYHNPDKAKGERYQAWLKGQKSDLYINQTVKILSDIINAANVHTVSK